MEPNRQHPSGAAPRDFDELDASVDWKKTLTAAGSNSDRKLANALEPNDEHPSMRSARDAAERDQSVDWKDARGEGGLAMRSAGESVITPIKWTTAVRPRCTGISM